MGRIRRGFVFSFDAFIAFSLALIAITSLLFFYSIPRSYVYSLVQAKYLANDALYSLAESGEIDDVLSACGGSCERGGVGFLDSTIPEQFDYFLEVKTEDGEWEEIEYKKIKAVSQIVYPFYEVEYDIGTNQYNYNGYCSGTLTQCDEPHSSLTIGQPHLKVIRLTVYR